MDEELLCAALALRRELSLLAERSGEEKKTRTRLMAFLLDNTSLRLEDQGEWFYAVHEETGARETIAFRADMDALPYESGARHLCGHDGHSAALAGLGLWLEGKQLGRNVVLLFQHAEETGAGGPVCAAAVKALSIDRIYAFHNIPGYPEGSVLLRRGAFACASRGMTLRFSGAPAHAAYPEFGCNPGFAAARLMAALPCVTDPAGYRGLTMATLIGARIGTKSFGSAAGDGEVWLTLRAWNQQDLDLLQQTIEETAREEAGKDNGVEVSFSFCDSFPATVNDDVTLHRLECVCREFGLSCLEVPEPFRWSEDFGWYGSAAKAAMVGIGAGVDWPQLHTRDYVFNDAVLPAALTLFSALAEFG